MAARAIRRISQPNSRHSACIKIACLNKKDSRRATATACAAPLAQALPRDSIRGQNPKRRSVSDRTAFAVRASIRCAGRDFHRSAIPPGEVRS